MESGDEDVAIAMRSALSDPDSEVRLVAVHSIGRMADKLSVPAIGRLLMDQDDLVRAQAIWALGEIGEPAREFIPIIVNDLPRATSFQSYHDLLRARTLSKLDRSYAEAQSVLVRLLSDDDSWIGGQAARTIGENGVATEQSLSELRNQMVKGTPYLQLECALALSRLGKSDESTISALIRVIESKSSLVLSYKATSQLGKIGGNSSSIISVLSRVSKDHSPLIRAEAIRALEQVHRE